MNLNTQPDRTTGDLRLRVFRSAVTDRFDPEHSDVAFLVDFIPGRGDRFGDHFGLREAHIATVGREVDLVISGAVRNPYLKANALKCAQDVYAV